MKTKEYQNFGSTTACVMRGVSATSEFDYIPREEKVVDEDKEQEEEATPRKILFYGYSWFGSVKTAKNVNASGNHCVMLIKTAHYRSPKKCLKETMKDNPGGTWIVMEGKTEKTVQT